MPEFTGIVHIKHSETYSWRMKQDDEFQWPRAVFVVAGNGKEGVSFQNKITEFDKKIQSGTMESRDWKCRYDSHNSPPCDVFDLPLGSPNPICVKIGPTSWQEWREDYNRSEQDAAALQERGLLEHNNRGFYLSQGLGACVLTLTSEGHVVVGIRASDSYDGAIHGAAGWMRFHPDLKRVHPEYDARRELEEELGVLHSNVESAKLIGLIGYPKTLEADFVYVVKTDRPTAYFTSGAWKSAVDAREHKELVVLSNHDEVGRLLSDGKVPGSNLKQFDIIPSTHYGLDVLLKNYEIGTRLWK